MMHPVCETSVRGGSQAQWAGEFLDKWLPEAFQDLASIAHPAPYASNRTLFSEKDPAQGVYLLLEGEVKLSMNSIDGRRLILRIAKKGEILGLASALSGKPYEVTAETLYPCRLAFVTRREFLGILVRHPEMYQTLTEELSRNISAACDQLRTVGLSASVPEKLARLLLDWSETGQTTENGTRLRFSLTHGEIGEFIGASRETVTRTLSLFKTRRLVMFNGSMVTIPNKAALESYARC
jgi:CRP/FNR family transcriptional regulator